MVIVTASSRCPRCNRIVAQVTMGVGHEVMLVCRCQRRSEDAEGAA